MKIDAQILFEALGDLDEALLEEAHDTDDQEKLKLLKKETKKRIFVFTPYFKRITAVCVSVAIIIASVITASLVDDINIKVVNNHTSNKTSSNEQPSKEESDNVFEDITTSENSENNSSNASSSSEAQSSSSPSSNNNSAPSSKPSSSVTQGGSNSSSSSSSPSDNTSSDEDDKKPTIKSLDEVNFYAAKKILSDRSLLPLSNTLSPSQVKTVILNEGEVYCYKIDKNTKITVSMITYFTVNLSNEKGFLAQKLGGTGLVEVVITANSLDNMITFKRGENYYSCLWDSVNYTGDGSNITMSMSFSTHKYIEGFNLIKNFEQESFQFYIFFEGSKVVRIECECYNNVTQSQYFPDEITLTNDGCIVMFVNESLTIDQLEGFVIKNGFEKENKA